MTAHWFDAVRSSPFYGAEHEAFRQSLRRFVAREIEPYANQWDEAGEFPREFYRKAAEVGYMGLGFPERYGGTGGDRFMRIIAMQEIARAGCGGVAAGLFSHTIGAPPILHFGSEEMKARVLPQILRARKSRPSRSPSPAAAPMSRVSARPRGARAIITWSTAPRPSSPRACGPTSSRWRCAPAAPARAASALSWSKASRRVFSVRCSRRWAGGAPTPRPSISTIAGRRRKTSSARKGRVFARSC